MGSFKHALLRNAEEEMPYFYFICASLAIGAKTYTKMQSIFGSPREFYEAGFSKWESSGLFTKKQLESLHGHYTNTDPKRSYENMKQKNIRLIPIEAPEFPERLRNIPEPPKGLFVKGKLPDCRAPLVSVIGARECSLYGTEVARKLGEALAYAKIPLVSGMARGIDSLSQIAAVNVGGYSLAVLGGGVDIVYPRESINLYRMLESRGAIVSEYPPGQSPEPQFFALRNRLISGLSDAICVVEARLKSGTMITVDAALEQGREVYVVPGRLSDMASRGCHELIKQGAGIITDIDEFVEDIKAAYDSYSVCEKHENTGNLKDVFNKLSKLDLNEKELLRQLSAESFTVDELANICRLDTASVISGCLELTKAGLCVNMGAGRFRINTLGIEIKNCMEAQQTDEVL